MPDQISIVSRDYWFKVVAMLQQNWALVDDGDDKGATVFFIGDTSGGFDQMTFPDHASATAALTRNGFSRYAEDARAQSFIAPPLEPFHWREHPDGRIYSSGKFWDA